jgi:hypothetical protein
MSTPLVPVLLIVFNRPDLTTKVFERIRQMQPTKLFIAADGPRADRPGEEALCRETRAATATIDWPCQVHRLERKENVGCKLGAYLAISWFFEYVEEGIILEDDCLPHPTFFRFCSELLERYRDVPEVALISGNNFQASPSPYSYYFTRYAQIWGWATWQRTWQTYDLEIASWSGDADSLRSAVRNARVRRYFAKQFNAVKFAGKDTWDYQMIHLCLTKGLICINPKRNLVENIGFDERATHTLSEDPENPMPTALPMDFPLSHPPSRVVDERADRYTETHVRGIPPNLFASWVRSYKKRFDLKKFDR